MPHPATPSPPTSPLPSGLVDLHALHRARELLAAAKVDVFLAQERLPWLPGTRRRRVEAAARLAAARTEHRDAERTFADLAAVHGYDLDALRVVDESYL
jgi:hypothetical protein